MVDETRQLRPRLASPLERNLHDQVVPDRAGDAESQHEFNSSFCQFRFDGQIVGRGERKLHSHLNETHGAGLFGSFQSRR
jgi:hypothetical protein